MSIHTVNVTQGFELPSLYLITQEFPGNRNRLRVDKQTQLKTIGKVW